MSGQALAAGSPARSIRRAGGERLAAHNEGYR